ncbi:MAG: FHA domain-containing protein [Armatimonadetes bacterium]|nr:FHA domain-containing protein [Armatimonadota bacterium]
MSRRHGRLFLQDGGVWYEDLGSSNGGWIGTQRLSGPIKLRPGQEVRLGLSRLERKAAGEAFSLDRASSGRNDPARPVEAALDQVLSCADEHRPSTAPRAGPVSPSRGVRTSSESGDQNPLRVTRYADP